MKVAVCSSGNHLDSPLDPRFGRCAYFVVVDTETMEFNTHMNPGAMMGQGAGIQVAQLLSNQGIEAVIAGHFGPNAYQVLAAAGIKILIAAGVTVRQAVELLKAGTLQEVSAPTVAAHFGMGQAVTGASPGFGPGMGGGMGQGRGGRGRGGFGRGRG